MKVTNFKHDFGSKVSRELITKFGESIYQNDEIRAISVKVEFKDGSAISFSRDEDEDDFLQEIKESENER